MSEFKKGQRVKVEYEGVITAITQQSAWVKPGKDNPAGIGFCVPKGSVTILDPAAWPPEVGDIWEAEGREYMAYEDYSESTIIHPFDRGTGRGYLGLDLNEFKGLNPVLVRRRGQ